MIELDSSAIASVREWLLAEKNPRLRNQTAQQLARKPIQRVLSHFADIGTRARCLSKAAESKTQCLEFHLINPLHYETQFWKTYYH